MEPIILLSPGDGIVMTLLRKDGTPYNLLLWSSRAVIRDVLNTIVGEFAITIIDAAKGIVSLNLPNPSAINAIPPGRYVFNVLLWNGTNEDRLKPRYLKILPALTLKL
jgi:hypothetical protein